MRLLVIGAGGQLGSKLIWQALDLELDVYGGYVTRHPALPPAHALKLDKTKDSEISAAFERVKPEVVVDAAALTNVDYCETHRAESWNVNVEGSEKIARLCSGHKAKLVYVSTDYVFDGAKGMYSEEDLAQPLNYYGECKQAAENQVLKICPDALVVRPSIIYSWTPQTEVEAAGSKPLNFAMWILKKVANGEAVRIVGDQYNSPTLADRLGEGILKSIDKGLSGVIHMSGASRLSRYEFARKLVQSVGLDVGLVQEIRTEEMKWTAQRPRDSSLSIEKAKHHGIRMPEIGEALDVIHSQADIDTLISGSTRA